MNPALGVDSLVQDLSRLGITHGDVVMVHASLKAIGPVAGGAAGVITALDQAVGPVGSLLMMVGAADDWAWVNTRPEPERAALLATAEPFGGAITPAQEDVGVLAEVFRQQPDTRVNDHPEGRFAARGPRAAELVTLPPWDDYYGFGSPLERLIALGGKVLRLGADLDTVTLLHYAEYVAAVPNKRRVRRHRLIKAADGPQVRVLECLDDEFGIVDHPGEDYFATVLRSYLATGRARTAPVGQARSELIDAADLVDHAVRWMEAHLGGASPG